MSKQPSRELDFSEVKSTKLKEIYMYLKTEKVPFYVSAQWNLNMRYRYEIIVDRRSKPLGFPLFKHPPLRYVSASTIVFDMETKERLDIPLRTHAIVRIKGPRKGQIFQINLLQGSVEVTDIRRVHVSSGTNKRSILMACYLDPSDISRSC